MVFSLQAPSTLHNPPQYHQGGGELVKTFTKIYLETFIECLAAGIFKKFKTVDISLIMDHKKVLCRLVSTKGIRNSNHFI